MKNKNEYDVIVVGSGHAGCEAALASARIGCKTILFTINIDNSALMPCNPAIGGPAKGQIVGEIDALGGKMGMVADKTHIQMKVLNRSRGQAVQCLRSQNDKHEYSKHMLLELEQQSNLDIRQAMIDELIVENQKVIGVITDLKKREYAKTVVLTTGTFLNGKVFTGMESFSAGRQGEFSANKLSQSISKHLRVGRLKTGTPPRLDARSIDFSKMTKQPGDDVFLRFSFKTPINNLYKKQLACYLTYTTPETHKIILDNLDRSPLFQKVIQGTGPRYCPSIEDKIVRFPNKDSHQIFIEPEGRYSCSIYPQGLNTSLPEDVQENFLKSIPGLENVKILKIGYAIEYDFVFPDQLLPTLETRPIKNLFLAGQINGTSGYEEAAGQGLVAGANAALKAKDKPALIIKREEAYIGTLIDDLITKPIIEPYRMLTSRSEHRIILRQDNATFRLGEKAFAAGLLSEDEISQIRNNKQIVENLIKSWKTELIPTSIQHKYNMKQRVNIFAFLKTQQSSLEDLIETNIIPKELEDLANKAFIKVRYEGYLARQKREIEKITKYESKKLPLNFEYKIITGLKKESQEKLQEYKPSTIYEAKRIAGINPVDILVLITYFEKHGNYNENKQKRRTSRHVSRET
jgi:tRNA uridine 5-carboxymethylaminomethyl modification enzyme